MRRIYVLFAFLQVLLGFRSFPFHQPPDKDDTRTSYTITYLPTAEQDRPQTQQQEATARMAYERKVLHGYRDPCRCYADRRERFRHIIAFPSKNMDDTSGILL